MQLMQRHTYPNVNALAEGFAGYAVQRLSEALTYQETVSLVVPGGSTPRIYLPALAAKALPWDRVAITLSDERWVDVESENSNENLVSTCLLDNLKVQPRFVGLKTLHDTPEAAIPDICQSLESLPQPFTLTVLGLGEDGHIASLFPGLKLHEAKQNIIERCIAVGPPIAPSLRASLSLGALTESEQIILVVTGKNKRQLLDKIEKHTGPTLPIAWLLERVQSPVVVFETD